MEGFTEFQEFGADLCDEVYKLIKDRCTEFCINGGGATREAIDLLCQAVIHTVIGVHADATGQDFSTLVGDMLEMEQKAMSLEVVWND